MLVKAINLVLYVALIPLLARLSITTAELPSTGSIFVLLALGSS